MAVRSRRRRRSSSRGLRYVQDESGTVYAIDVSSGQVKWRTKALGFGIGPYGVSVGWGKLFASTPNGAAAFRLSDGTPLWNRQGHDFGGSGCRHPDFCLTGGWSMWPRCRWPSASFTPAALLAISRRWTGGTGKVDWRFDTVDSKDLWGNPEVNSGGGSWYPPAIDTRTGVVYWGVANPAPFVGTPQYPNGSSRPGANLYTDSMVALSARTGKTLWYHQAGPHDLYDRDQVQAMLVPVRAPVERDPSRRG